MKRQLLFLLAGIAAMALLSAEASATVLYSDTFSRVTGSGDPNGNPGGGDPGPGFSDWGTNDNGLGGTNAVAWVAGPSRGGGANQVTNGTVASTNNGLARMSYDATGDAPNGFSVGLDFNRDHQFNGVNPAGNGYMTIALGLSTDVSNTNPDTNVGNSQFAFLVQQASGGNAGNTQIFEDGAFLAGTGATGDIDYGDPGVGHAVLMTFVPQATGAYGDSDLIDFTITVDGDPGKSFSGTTSGGPSFGALSLASNTTTHRQWDNVVITAIPEPATVGLAGVCGILGLMIRKRS